MSIKEVTNFTQHKKKKIVYDDSDSDDEIIIIKKKSKGEKGEKGETQWIYVWYDPSIGLPPGVRLLPGMKLPTYPCELYIHKAT
jgi:hypothetical protein